VALDSCGNPAIESSLARTILLEVQAQDYFHNTLSWSPYIDWGWAPPQQYRIMRSIDGIPEAFPIDPQYPLDTSYLDDVSGFGASAGRFSYTIEALQGPGNPDFRDTVRSNTVEVRQQTAVFIPNAFTPQGANPVFKPVLLFHDIADYQMSIYNRWGQRIFHTSHPNLPWDGTLNNKPVPAGTYVCLLRVRRSDNSLVERRTMVNVIY
jgi:gliding motility-associated-like protein